jgi:hypothetical protein
MHAVATHARNVLACAEADATNATVAERLVISRQSVITWLWTVGRPGHRSSSISPGRSIWFGANWPFCSRLSKAGGSPVNTALKSTRKNTQLRIFAKARAA